MKRGNRGRYFRTVFSLAILGFLLFVSNVQAQVVDEANFTADDCLKCHGYKEMGHSRKNGTTKYFFVDPILFDRSVHGNVSCKDCHQIKDIPHTAVTETTRVYCGRECHMIEPSQAGTRTRFSHNAIYNIFKDSVHKRGEVYTGGFDDDGNGIPIPPEDRNVDAPACKYCHINPLYNTRVDGSRPKPEEDLLYRCQQCHPGPMRDDGTPSFKFASRFYMHVTHRLQRTTKRSPEGIVNLCGSCHANKPLMAKHNVRTDIVDTYKKTFHWKAIKFGHKGTAHCVSCHVLPGHSVHDIRGKNDKESAIYKSINMRTGKMNKDDKLHMICGRDFCHPTLKMKEKNYELHRLNMHLTPTLTDSSVIIEFMVEEMFFWLCTATVTMLCVIMLLELIRRFFPPKHH